MLSLYTISSIIFLHRFFDFFLQTDEQEKGKSKENEWLTLHVSTYSVGLILMCLLNAHLFKESGSLVCFLWVALNAFLHWCIDYCTSRASSLLWENNKTHDFFVITGADQMLHYFTLFSTLIWFTS